MCRTFQEEVYECLYKMARYANYRWLFRRKYLETFKKSELHSKLINNQLMWAL